MVFEKLLPNAAASFVCTDNSCYHKQYRCQQSPEAVRLNFKPDLYSENKVYNLTQWSCEHHVHLLNIAGYIPGISFFSGAYRSALGTAYLFKGTVCHIFDKQNRDLHKEAIKIASTNVLRGMLEIIPIVGNLFALSIDANRMMHRWCEFRRNCFLFGDKREIAIFRDLDCITLLPIVGTVVSIAYTAFWANQTLINLASWAKDRNDKYRLAASESWNRTWIQSLVSVPVLGYLPVIFLQDWRWCEFSGRL